MEDVYRDREFDGIDIDEVDDTIDTAVINVNYNAALSGSSQRRRPKM